MASSGRCVAYVALALMTLACSVDLSSAQARCFNLEFFSCNGPVSQQAATGEECCNQGFLAYEIEGVDICIPCTQNGVCSSSTTCSEPFDASRAQNNAECCATGSGVAYTNSVGQCVQCFGGCFPQSGCNGTPISLSSSGLAAAQARECCVNFNQSMSYTIAEQCFECTVFGFLQSRLEESERGQGYSVEIGYLKRSSTVPNIVRGDINILPGTAGSIADFTVSSRSFTVRPMTSQDIIVTFRVDSIAQESVETAQLELEINIPAGGIPNAFILDTLDLVISDSDRVVFQLTETDYSANEQQEEIVPTINKNLRIANPVEFLLTPYTVSGAMAAGVPLDMINVPPDDNRFSPNRAQLTEGREDFSDDVIRVRFEADAGEGVQQVSDIPVPIVVFDDEIDEAQEEVFVIDITLVNSTNDNIEISRRSSLGRISDNDDLRIGFQNASYTFSEPDFETLIFDNVFLEKQDGVITEQTYVVVIEVNEATPDTGINPATLQTDNADNDYSVTGPDVRSIVLEFPPEDQTLAFDFTMFPDQLAEGTEAFQVTSQPSEIATNPAFTAPTQGVLFPSTFIVIEDNDPIVVGFEQNYTVSEDNGTFMACFRVINPPPEQELGFSIDFVVDTISGSASELDYTPIRSSDLDVFETLSNTRRRACFPVSITADNIYENTESFELALRFDDFVNDLVRNIVDIIPSSVMVTIVDATPLEIGFINAPYSGTEAGGVVTFEVGVTNGVSLEREVVVDFSTVDGAGGAGRDAIAGSDYVAISNMTLTFGPSQFITTVDVTVLNDTIFELSESFSGSLSASAALERFTLNPATAQANIIDDDVIVFGFNQTSYLIGEDDGAISAVVTFISGDAGVFTISANYTTQDGSALAGFDYEAASGTISISSGSLSFQFPVTIISDNLAEGLEMFGLSIFNFAVQFGGASVTLSSQELGRVLSDPASANVTIIDADNARIGFIGTEYNGTEGDLSIEFLIGVLSGNLAVPVQFEFATSDMSAIDGADYNAITVSRTLTGTEQTSVSVDLINDQIYELMERFSASLSPGTNFPSFVTLDPNSATADISDDDEIVIGFRETSYNVSEDAGTVTLEVAVLEGEIAAGVEFSISFFTADESAMAPGDYTALTRILVFNSASTSFMISVDIINDNLYENLIESFTGNLQLVGDVERVALEPDVATVNIQDDIGDALVIGFRETSYNVNEDAGSVTLEVAVLEGEIAEGVEFSVNFATADGTAIAPGDYTALTRDLVFSSTSTSFMITVDITDDDIYETLIESFTGNLQLVGDVERVTLEPDVATVNIQDDNADALVIGFRETSYNVSEDAGSVTLEVAVLEGEIAEGVEFSVNFATSDGSAIAPGDYTALTRDLVFSSTSTSFMITVDIINDDIYETLIESFTGSLQLVGDVERVTLEPDVATVNIQDDNADALVIGFREISYNVSEDDGSVTLEVAVLEGEIAEGVEFSVSFATADGSAIAPGDYTALTRDLVFSSTSTSFMIPVDIIDDDLFENTIESFTGNLQLVGDVERVTLQPNVATVDIEDIDELIIGFQPDSYTVVEGEDPTVQLVAMVISGTLGRDVEIDFTTRDQSALAGSDYIALSQVLTFTPSINNQTITVMIIDGNAVEPEEYFEGFLSTIMTIDRLTLAPEVANITILDGDMATVGFDRAEYDVLENQTFSNVTIRLDGIIDTEVIVRVTTEDDSAVSIGPEPDFVSHDMLYTFTPGGPSEIIVPIRILDDFLLENDEALTSLITLSTVTGDINLGRPNATIRIIDDDNVVIGFTMTLYEATEGVDSRVDLMIRVLSGTLRREVMVSFQTEDGSAIDGLDYMISSDGSGSGMDVPDLVGGVIPLTFDENINMATIPISILNDNINEVLERFIARLTTSDEDVILMPDEAIVEIRDNDFVNVSFRQPIYMFSENAGNGTVCVDKIGDTTQNISVMVSGPLQAETGERIDQTVTFTPDQTEVCLTFNIVDDDIALEETEMFSWSLTLPGDDPLVRLGENPNTDILILDDDVLTLTANKGGSISENATTVETCLTFSNPIARNIAVNRASQGGMAPNASTSAPAGIAEPSVDFVVDSAPLILTPDESTTGEVCFPIEIIDDSLVEEAMECFTLQLSMPESEMDNVILEGATQSCCILDDDTVTIGFDPIEYAANEGDGEVFLTVRIISGQLARPVEVLATTEDGSATSTAPADYVNPGTVNLQFDSVDTMQMLRILIEDDDIFEDVEEFFANLVSIDPAVIIAPGRAQIEIRENPADNDRPTIGFVPDNYFVTEDGGNVLFNVMVIDGTLERDVIVTFTTMSGSATEEDPADYIGSSVQLTFSGSITQNVVPITIIDDDIVEADESFTAQLTIADPMDAFLTPDIAIATISGDEPNDTVVIGLEDDYIIPEGSTQEVCAVLLSGTLEREAVVTISTVDGSATAPGDFDTLSAQLTFDADTSRVCANLSTVDDSVVEGPEDLDLTLTTDDDSVTLNPDTSDVTIVDNDEIIIGLRDAMVSVSEDQGVAEVCAIVISGDLERPVTFNLASTDGTATAPGDYESLSVVGLEFTADMREVCVNINIVDDNFYENDEIFTVTVTSDDPQATVQPDRSNATVTIQDNENIVIGFEPSEETVAEDDGTVELCARLLSENPTLEREVVVSFSTQDGEAEAPADYDMLTMELTFSAGQTEVCVNVVINPDDLTEGVETFTGVLTDNAGNPRLTLQPDQATVTITDTNVVIIGYLEEPYSFQEDSGMATVRVGIVNGRLDDEDLIVNIQSEDIVGIPNPALAGTDYEPINMNLTFTADITEISVNIPLIPDSITELDELFNTRLTILTQDLGAMIENNQPLAEVEIVDDDNITVSFEVDSTTELENVTVVMLCAVISDGTLDRVAMVTVSSRDGTALADEDYQSFSTVLTFDSDTSRVCFEVSVIDDDRHELEESFDLVLTSDDDAVGIPDDTSVFTIEDDDEVVIGWEAIVYNFNETDGLVELCAIIVEGELTFELPAINIQTRDGSAVAGSDYTDSPNPSSFVFSDSAPTRQCTEIMIVNDDSFEEDTENFFVDLVESSSTERVTINPSTAEVIITDDDMVTIGFVETEVPVSEGDGSASLGVRVISGTLDRPAELQLATRDGSASSPDDYSSISMMFTFSPGFSGIREFSVPIMEDGLDELVENFFADLTLLSDSDRVIVDPNLATVTIVDNDGVTIEIEVPSVTEPEDVGIREVCAIVSNGTLARDTIITVSSEDGSAVVGEDYSGFSIMLTFGPDQTRQCFNVSITDDDRHEMDESFNIVLTSDDDQINNPRPNTPFNIEDDDEVVIGWEAIVYNVNETDGLVELCAVIVEGELTFELPAINIQTRDGSAVAGSDYTDSPNPSSFVFSDSAPTRQCTEIMIVNDDSFEEDMENFFVNLVESSSTDRVTIDPSTAEVIITDDDMVTIGFVETEVPVSEGDGSASLRVTVISGTLDRPAELQLATRDGSASSPDDYSSISMMFTFSPGFSGIREFSVPIMEDGLDEPVENFFADLTLLSDSDRVIVDPNLATVTIVDNDGVTIEIEVPSVTEPENVGIREVCAIVSNGTLARDTIITVSSEDGSAVVGEDFSGFSIMLTFGPDQTRQCFNVSITDDDRHEMDESFNIVLTSDDDQINIPRPNTPFNIEDDDEVVIGWEATVYNVNETDGFVELCAVIVGGELTFELPAINIQTQNGSAVSGSDYTDSPNPSSFVFSDSAPTRQCTEIMIVNDDSFEEDTENFFVDLVESSSTDRVTIDPSTAEVIITDDDMVTIGFVETEVSVSEGNGSASLRVRVISGTLDRPAELQLATRDGSANSPDDYSSISMMFTFSPGFSGIREFSVPIMEDSLDEPVENFFANLTLLSDSDRVIVDPNLATVTIVDNDGVTIEIEVPSVTEPEDVGIREVCAIVSNGTLARDTIITVSSEDGSAVVGEDFSGFSIMLTFGPDQTRQCFNVSITDDDRHEMDESFNIVLTSDDDQINIPRPNTPFNIEDDDEVVIGWEATVYNVNETDGLVELCAVIVEGELTFELPTINIQTRDGSAVAGSDYTDSPNPSSFVFSDSAPTRQCTEIMIVNDDSFEEDMENFFVDLVESSSTDRVTIDPSTAEVIITDDDMVTIGFVETEVPVSEGDGSASLRVRVISGTLDRPAELQLATRNGSASSPDDYSSISMMFIFSPGFSGIREFLVPIVDDNIDESDEDFFADLTLLSDSDRITIDPELATVTIVDNDVVRIGLEREVYITRENETEMICAEVLDDSPSLDRQVIITISSTDGSATAPDDYEQINENLTFGPGMSRACIEVTPEEDGVVEGPESFNVTLTDGDSVELIPDTAVVVIEEEDMVTVMFRLPSYTFTEDGVTGTIEVVKSGFTDEPFSVRVTGGPSEQPDIVVSAAGIDEVVTFEGGPASEDTIEISFDLTDDEIALEPIESYIASLSIEGSPAGVVLGTLSTTTINVLDNDDVTVGFGRPDLTVDEDAGTFMMCVVLEGETLQNVSVTIESVDGSATSPSDYSASSIPSSLVILAGEDRECFEGDIVDDSILEPTESFTLTITAVTPNGVTISQDTTEIFINDVEDARVRFDLPEYTFSEPDGSGMVCLIKDIATSDSVTVEVTTSPGTASANLDYGPGPYTVTFSSMANDRQCITIPIIADSITEGSETFTADIVVTPGSGLVPGTPATTTITITEPGPTGVLVNDTAIGDPLMTVPIFVSDEDLQELGVDRLSLCYEIHGVRDQFFNLITDECTSVNAHYTNVSDYLNVIGQIGVRASDNNRQCREILVDVDGCTASVDGTNLALMERYMSAGISVRRYSNRVRISVPNCNEQSLVMWVFCESRTLDDPEAPNGQLIAQMIKFVVMRGLNFGHRDAHGLIGQFWNRPARVIPFEGVDRNGQPVPERYVINITSPISGEGRSFTGWLYDLTWEFEEGPCLYAGNRQGGPIYEVTDPNDPVIEGRYGDYRVDSAFSEDGYSFSLFNNDMCVEIGSGSGTDEPLSTTEPNEPPQ